MYVYINCLFKKSYCNIEQHSEDVMFCDFVKTCLTLINSCLSLCDKRQTCKLKGKVGLGISRCLIYSANTFFWSQTYRNNKYEVTKKILILFVLFFAETIERNNFVLPILLLLKKKSKSGGCKLKKLEFNYQWLWGYCEIQIKENV